jgi:tRNA G18 (ribose-2'-O)-methylase SpoU
MIFIIKLIIILFLKAIAKMPSPGECKIERTLKLPFLLVLDQIRDPGNMGTIIRTAAAVGCDKILITKGCVDIWDPKVIRSAMGAHFRIPILNNLSYEQILSYLPIDTKILFADNNKSLDRKITDYSDLHEIKPHATLIIGNETLGISTKINSLIASMIKDRIFVNIPLENGVESLNASIAFSVLSYEIRKQLLLKK